MHIGVLTALYQDLPFAEVLDKVKAMGVTAVEIGTGAFAASAHLDLARLMTEKPAREAYLDEIHQRGMFISALSCHGNPLHPDPAIANHADDLFRKTVQLAQLMTVPVVNTFSGLPAGCEGDRMPNWVTCPWPPDFLEILDYQWNQVAIPYWKDAAAFAADHGVKIGIEIHPGMLIYNVETLLRMRSEVGQALGANLDPSHLVWNGVELVAAIRTLGDAIHHVHGKDCYIDPLNVAVNGCNDHKPYHNIPDRSWTFRTIGYGHDLKFWKDFASALRLVGYDYVISIEHEDALMSNDEGLVKAITLLKEAIIFDPPGAMFWA
ncbi:MAG TPA: sugar phosphate isomerase/epimerase [Brevefilum sp.]|nr:sugar phosphate isomerase/epimerase [Brevefilum sp.]HOR19827.1 sugar phosphate isomerase/epimerase [Brevefilum sp.]HPL68882.1 sugar phosphate isomerase/epimerase [Brevefilum sp.]